MSQNTKHSIIPSIPSSSSQSPNLPSTPPQGNTLLFEFTIGHCWLGKEIHRLPGAVEAGQWRRCRKGTTIFFDGVDIQKKTCFLFGNRAYSKILKEAITHTLVSV